MSELVIGGDRYLLVQADGGTQGFVRESEFIPVRRVTPPADELTVAQTGTASNGAMTTTVTTTPVLVRKPRKPRETKAKPGKGHPSKNGSAPKAEREAVIAEFTAGLTLAEARKKYPDEPYSRLWSWSKAAEARA
jgi:hypothetical protein